MPVTYGFCPGCGTLLALGTAQCPFCDLKFSEGGMKPAEGDLTVDDSGKVIEKGNVEGTEKGNR